jgi:hypothetical protein
MTTDVDICNMALGKIGTRTTIVSLTEGSNEANQCNIYYTNTRDALLRSHRWDFIRNQASLALIADATIGQTVPIPWAYEYAYPSDCLKPWYMIPNPVSTPGTYPFPTNFPAISVDNPPVKYVVGTDIVNGVRRQVILTNLPQAILVYGVSGIDPSFYDTQFVELLSIALAAAICVPLTGNAELKNSLHDEVFHPQTGLLVRVTASNANDQLTIHDHLPEWIRVRGFANGQGYPDVLGTDTQPGY